MIYLKQSTASQSILLGPFVDSTDGVTAETGLTIANTDIRLSKNGGNMAAKNSGGGTHDENGWYTITLDATDTNTVGRLQISVAESGALPVWVECHVLEEAIYDAIFGASADAFDSNARIKGVAGTKNTLDDLNDVSTAQVNTECDTALTDYDPPTKAELDSGLAGLNDISTADVDARLAAIGLDHLVSASVTGTDVADDSIIAQLVSSSATADWDDYVNTTDSLQAVRDRGDSDWITATGFSTHSAADVRSEIDSNSTQLAAIVADTNELQGDWANGGRLDLILDARASQTSVDTIDGIVDAILLDTAEIGAAGAGLTEAGGTGDQFTAIPWNAAWDAEVQSEVTDALNAYDPPTKAELDSGFAALNDVSTAQVNAEVDTALADIGLDHLVSASVTGTDVTDDSIIAQLVSSSATADWDDFVNTTDSLQGIREEGDASWGSGASNPNVLLTSEISSVTNQTTIVLVDGADVDDSYNDQTIVLYDDSNSDYPSVRVVSDYVGSTKTITLDSAPDFTVGADDSVRIFATAPGTSAPTAAQVRAEIDSNSTQLAAIVADTNELQTDWADGGRLDAILDARSSQASVDTVDSNVDAILVDTGTTLPATLTTIEGKIDTVDTVVDTILVDTNELQTNQGDWATATGFSTHSAADVRTEMDSNSTQLAAIVADTNELQGDWANGGRLDLIVDAILVDTGTTLPASIATIDSNVDAILVDTGTTLPASISGLNDISVSDVLTTAMTESYGTDGSALTLAQCCYLILGNVSEFALSGTTKTVKQLDGSTTAATYTLDDADNPTSTTRAS